MSIESRLQAIEERIDASQPEEPHIIHIAAFDGRKSKEPILVNGLPYTGETFPESALVAGVPVPYGQPRLDGKSFTREPGESREDFEQRVETFRQELIQKSKQIKPTFTKLNKRSIT